MEASQFLERFRLLSREIQLGIQSVEKRLDLVKKISADENISKISDAIRKIDDDWSDFSGWVLVSTLDNIEEARRNSVSGIVNFKSKILRSKKRSLGAADQHGVRIDIKECQDAEISTYITYLEQFLDLIFLNAVKYSPKGYTVNVSSSWKNGNLFLLVESMGPLIEKHEKPSLGKKGFRSENAIKTQKPGDGFGLWNIFRLSELLNADLKINLTHKNLFEIGGIAYSDYCVEVVFDNFSTSSLK